MEEKEKEEEKKRENMKIEKIEGQRKLSELNVRLFVIFRPIFPTEETVIAPTSREWELREASPSSATEVRDRARHL